MCWWLLPRIFQARWRLRFFLEDRLMLSCLASSSIISPCSSKSYTSTPAARHCRSNSGFQGTVLFPYAHPR